MARPEPLVVECVGGHQCGEHMRVTASPLRVERQRGGATVYDTYRLVQLPPGTFIYRHQGETDCEDE